MSKWRNSCPDKLLTSIANISEARLYLLRQTGPTGFLLQEHDGDTKFKVLLGATHSCDCSFFLKEKELCTHILWILIRKFRVPKEDPVAFQLGLCERELNNVLYGDKPAQTNPVKVSSTDGAKQLLKQKKIDKEDVCPICQDEIYKSKKCLSYCKFGCGNSVHVSCIKIWADHQFKSTREETIKCPLCRTEFASYKSILEEHRRSKTRSMMKKNAQKTKCSSCKEKVNWKEPVYRCEDYASALICSNCFLPYKHKGHVMEVRNPRTKNWSKMRNEDITLCIGSGVCGNFIDGKPLPRFFGNAKASKLSRFRSSSQIDLRDLNFGINGLGIGPLQPSSAPPGPPSLNRRVIEKRQRIPGRRTQLPPLVKAKKPPPRPKVDKHSDLFITSSPITKRIENADQLSS